MKEYTSCPKAVADRVSAIVKQYFPELKKLGVRIDLLFVSHDGEGPALKYQGYAAAAVVRVTNAKERAAGRGDAEIVIDEEGYEHMPDDTKTALLHHELYHLVAKKDRDKKPKADASGRPVLGIRKHDRQFGWFDETARIFGESSIEVQQARRLVQDSGQTYFDFAKVTPIKAVA